MDLFESIVIGSSIPSFVRKTDYANWNRFAAVNDEFVYSHMDDDAGRNAGNEKGGFGMGNLRWAYLHCMLREWLGDEGIVKEMSVQYRAVNQKNDTLTCGGKITEKYVSNGEQLARIDLSIVNQDGVETTPGYAVVAVPKGRSTSRD